MKVSFEKEKLLAALVPASSISQMKNSLVSVGGLLFECPADEKFGKVGEDEEGCTRISAYDLEKGLRTTVPCKVYEPGNYVISASRILQIVRYLPDGEVTIEVDDKLRAVISGGQASYTISVSPCDDFPAMPMFIGDKKYTLPQYAVRTLVSRVIFAVAQEDQRVELNGAFMKVKDGVLTLVGCDKSRLSLASYDLDGDADPAEIIIPGKFLGELIRILRDSEDDTTLIIGRKHVIFKIDRVYFFTRLIESKYMDYERIFKKDYTTEAYLDPAEFRDALERASIISEDKLGGKNRAMVKLDLKGSEITVSCVSSEGSIVEKVPAAIGGDELTIGFNGRYLLEALKACPEEVGRIRMRFKSAVDGVWIESSEGSRFITFNGDKEKEKSDDEKFDFLHFVMPRSINKQ